MVFFALANANKIILNHVIAVYIVAAVRNMSYKCIYSWYLMLHFVASGAIELQW